MKTCLKCGSQFKTSQRINGKRHSLRSRLHCLDCVPFKRNKTSKDHTETWSKYYVYNDQKNIVARLCTRCKLTKPIESFYKKSRGHHSYCHECLVDVTLERQRNFRDKCLVYKGGQCEKCGYNKCPAAMHFHHKDPKQKEFEISKAHRRKFGTQDHVLKKELDKCALLCANCHAEVHYREITPL